MLDRCGAMDCFSGDDGEFLVDSDFECRQNEEDERIAAEAEAASLGLLNDDEPDLELPVVETPSHASGSILMTPVKQHSPAELDFSVEKRPASSETGGVVSRKRLRGKQSVASSAQAPVAPEHFLIDGKRIQNHHLFVRYWKTSAEARRLASKRVSQCKYRLIKELDDKGSVQVYGETLLSQEDRSEAVADVERVFFRGLATDPSKSALDRGYALTQLSQLEKNSGAHDLDPAATPVIKGVPSALLTYIGDVGVIDVNTIQVPGGDASENQKGSDVVSKFERLRAMPIDDVATLLKEHKQVEALFTELVTQAVNTINRLRTTQWAVTVELCGKTLASTDVLRVHGHVWISLNGQALELSSIAVDNGKCVPFANWKALRFLSGCSARAAASQNSGAFYCTIQKRGTVLQKSTVSPWVDFSVRDSWITSMYSADKIGYEVAREAYLKTIHRAPCNVSQLDFCHKERQKAELAKRMERIENDIRSTLLPWKTIPAVDSWKEQYSKVLGRYTFLVLDGKSCYGKTKYAFSLCEAGRCYYCDCTSGVPDLRGFDFSFHRAVIFDELSPRAGILLKKALQASNEPVVMGVSPTMISSYTVHLWRIPLIVCTNLWDSGLKKMKKVDRDWLRTNSVYVKVREPLWVQT